MSALQYIKSLKYNKEFKEKICQSKSEEEFYQVLYEYEERLKNI